MRYPCDREYQFFDFFFLNPFFRLSAGLQRKGARVKNPNRFDTGF